MGFCEGERFLGSIFHLVQRTLRVHDSFDQLAGMKPFAHSLVILSVGFQQPAMSHVLQCWYYPFIHTA